MESAPPFEERRFRRVTGSYTTGQRGPMIMVTAGVHGNEPAGLHAQARVLARLQKERIPIAGKLVAITGNLGALGRGERFLSRDLNRQWSNAQIASLLAKDHALDDDEDREQRDLLRVFDECLTEADGPVVVLDLHTSSADGPPFCCLGDTLPNRHLAFALELPVILGLEETIDGAVLEYFSERGLAGIAVEGGRHDRDHTIDCLEAAIWLTLIASGALAESSLPDVDRMREMLGKASRGVPPVVEIRNHHRIVPADEFVMQPGYESFQHVERGEVLAQDKNGEIRATENGRVLLPLYQGLGEDGFFLCREVRPFWLSVARWMRRMRFDVLLPLLPGVRRHPDQVDTLVVDPQVARVLVREVFHLLGYRRCRPNGEHLVFTRRQVAPETWQLPWKSPPGNHRSSHA